MTKQSTDLQQQVQWQHPERPVLLSWDIKARNYNTIVMECFFAVITSMAIGMTILFYYMFSDKTQTGFQWNAFWASIPIFIFIFPVFYTWTHPRKTFVYRFTKQGYEEQGWNDIEIWKKVVLVVGIVLLVAILGLATIFPRALLGLLIGPPLMALFYYRMFASQDYWEMQQSFTKSKWLWSDFNGIHIYRKRAIIILLYEWDRREDKDVGKIIQSDTYLYCSPEKLDEVIAFIKSHTNNLPSKEGYYSIIMC